MTSLCAARGAVIPASKQTAALGALKGEVGACQSCCETPAGRGRGLWVGLAARGLAGSPPSHPPFLPFSLYLSMFAAHTDYASHGELVC